MTGKGYDHLPEHRRKIYTGDRCTDFDDLLDQAHSDGKIHHLTAWPDGTPIEDVQDAWRLLSKLANCKYARQFSVHRNQAAGLGPVELDDGSIVARYRVTSKDEGRAEIARRAEAGVLGWSPITEHNKNRGKYICRSCRHRRAQDPGSLCHDCGEKRAVRAAGETARELRQEAERIATRQWGEGWEHLEDWAVDHALAPPRTAAEKSSRELSEAAREHVDWERRVRHAGGADLPFEEVSPSRIAAGIVDKASQLLRDAKRTFADQQEASQVDPRHAAKVQEILDRYRPRR